MHIPDPPSYSYLLGLYLGDGCVSFPGRTCELRFSLDARYPEIVTDCWAALVLTVIDRAVRVRRHPRDRVVVVGCYWKHWPELIPQYGPGKKHERSIRLANWQRDLVDGHPQQFVRGLLHSDGCRTVNRFRVDLPSGRVGEYAYPRYFFSNLSPEIRALFCEYCDRLGIRWTRSNPRNISVSDRRSVARLDAFVGPKA